MAITQSSSSLREDIIMEVRPCCVCEVARHYIAYAQEVRYIKLGCGKRATAFTWREAVKMRILEEAPRRRWYILHARRRVLKTEETAFQPLRLASRALVTGYFHFR